MGPFTAALIPLIRPTTLPRWPPACEPLGAGERAAGGCSGGDPRIGSRSAVCPLVAGGGVCVCDAGGGVPVGMAFPRGSRRDLPPPPVVDLRWGL